MDELLPGPVPSLANRTVIQMDELLQEMAQGRKTMVFRQEEDA